jgi:hypothetical protein
VSDTSSRPEGGTSAVAPPAPPQAPPATATGAPPPPRRRRGGLLAVLLLALALLALLVVLGLRACVAAEPQQTTLPQPVAQTAFDSAMRKAGVKSPPPPSKPIPLSRIKATGTHRFSATFTYEEVSALLQTFTFTDAAKGALVEARELSREDDGSLRLDGRVTLKGAKYSGWVRAPVVYAGGQLQSSGPFNANIDGITLTGNPAAQIGRGLLGYFSDYLKASPALRLSSAVAGPDGVKATGSAADAIAW